MLSGLARGEQQGSCCGEGEGGIGRHWRGSAEERRECSGVFIVFGLRLISGLGFGFLSGY